MSPGTASSELNCPAPTSAQRRLANPARMSAAMSQPSSRFLRHARVASARFELGVDSGALARERVGAMSASVRTAQLCASRAVLAYRGALGKINGHTNNSDQLAVGVSHR